MGNLRDDRYLVVHVRLPHMPEDLMFDPVPLESRTSPVNLCHDEVPLTDQVSAPVDKPLLGHRLAARWSSPGTKLIDFILKKTIGLHC